MSASDVCADLLRRARGWKQEPSWAIMAKSLKIGACVEPVVNDVLMLLPNPLC